MPTHQVNLDALIERADLALVDSSSSGSMKELRVEDLLQTNPYLKLLRKPDFQRETSNWSPDKVSDFIASVVNRDFIPAIIIWESKSSHKLFVIDGAHRLSALIAWVNDDYGDGDISKNFFGSSLSEYQKRLANRTRDLVKEKVGAYKGIKGVLSDEAGKPEDMLITARRLLKATVPIQWVEDSSAEAAEASFKRINGNSTVIDPVEASIIDARRKPNAIATRAIMQAGTAFRYWARFPEKKRDEIEKLSKSIYKRLFEPVLEDPVKTLDVPIAGRGYSPKAFRMIFDLVNQTNELTPSMWRVQQTATKKKAPQVPLIPDDENGEATVNCLKKVSKASQLISSANYAGSLGLHPVVWFYGENGVFQPVALLAVVQFVEELVTKNKLKDFTRARAAIEDFLVGHKAFINDIVHERGSRTRPREALVEMYRLLLSGFTAKQKSTEIAAKVKAKFPFLKNPTQKKAVRRKRFAKDAISAAYIQAAIEKAPLCTICGARLHRNAITADHKLRKREGGTGDPKNAVLAHPYCNTGFKN